MAPIKFEENIKDKLDKRTIQPSTEAWNNLSERLNESEKKNSNKAVWWIGLAASIVGVVFVVSQFFSNNITNEIVPEIVDTPKVETIIKQTDKNQITEDEVIDKAKVEEINNIKKPEFKSLKVQLQ